MAVSEQYLNRIRRAIRRGKDDETDAEIMDLIGECRLDLIQLGVQKEKAEDEEDPLILGAVRCFVRWKFGIQNPEAGRMEAEYMTLRDELRRRRDYCISLTV